MPPGLLYVELAAPVGTGEASKHASGGVVIRRLREVQSSFGLSETIYDCSFAQRLPHRDKPFFVAPSAWELLPARSHFEFVVTQREPAKSLANVSTVIKLEDLSSSAERVAREASLPPSAVRSQAASSQATSFHAPATPSNTDDSDLEVGDSEDKSLGLRGGFFGPRGGSFAGEGDEGGGRFDAEPSQYDTAQCVRSASPSPSTLSSRNGRIKADLRRQIEESESQDRSPGSSSNPHDSSGSIPSREQDRTPRASRTRADSEASFRVGLDANGNVAFVAPSPAPWAPTSKNAGDGLSRKGKVRALEPTVASPGKNALKKELSSPAGFLAAPTNGRTGSRKRRTAFLHPDISDEASTSAGSSSLSSSRSFLNLSFGSTSNSSASASSCVHAPHDASDCSAAAWLSRTSPLAPIVALRRSEHPASSVRFAAAIDGPQDLVRQVPRSALFSILPPGRSERFHYWIRLPNWPTAPRNVGPLKPVLLFKQQARGDVTLGLTLARVFDAAAQHSGWEVRDLKATFYVPDDEGKEEDVVVWGWDTILTEFCDLEEMRLVGKGDVIDFEYVPYRASRGCYDSD
ncbi:proteophosphoglycan 5 [Rhodotorula toruloides]|uniref:Proteophosphoglycan 5 n=1 Tax=Rhodotorula toruloides TaxID=5286 RepID=A0A511KDD3_RHOTO|nr:proteophosphoglycan 5 [Rhodotorula toruloides]